MGQQALVWKYTGTQPSFILLKNLSSKPQSILRQNLFEAMGSEALKFLWQTHEWHGTSSG